eukprot:1157550-Pelagomonas_calceolata.AAC.4
MEEGRVEGGGACAQPCMHEASVAEGKMGSCRLLEAKINCWRLQLLGWEPVQVLVQKCLWATSNAHACLVHHLRALASSMGRMLRRGYLSMEAASQQANRERALPHWNGGEHALRLISSNT